jgi:hypothetical protein
MITLEPRKKFRANQPRALAHKELVLQATIHESLQIALAELAMRQDVSAEQLAGARRFITIWLNLAEDGDTVEKRFQYHLASEDTK